VTFELDFHFIVDGLSLGMLVLILERVIRNSHDPDFIPIFVVAASSTKSFSSLPEYEELIHHSDL
jgi:hypothetical protein